VSETPVTESLPKLEPLGPLLKALVNLIRAEDRYGAWERKPDHDLLTAFVVTKEARRAIPIVGDPGPEMLLRVEQFYKALCFRIEQRSGLMASPVMEMTHEGFGRLVLIVGKLVVYSKSLRDVHRFGFPSLEALVKDGEKAVDEAVQTAERFSDAARA
jgi:probable nitrogen fixation protein